MRHYKRNRKLNRTSSHRKALLSNLAAAFVMHKRIITTEQKGKELRSYVERLVTFAKKDNLHGRRLIMSKIIGKNSKKVANLLINDIGPQYNLRNGGYTRIIKLPNRKNDDAQMCLIEFVDLKITDNNSQEDKNIKEEKEK